MNAFFKPTRTETSFTLALFLALFLPQIAFAPLIDAVIFADTGFGCFECFKHTQTTGGQLLFSKSERLGPAAPYLTFYNLTSTGYILLLLTLIFCYLLSCSLVPLYGARGKQKKK